MRIIKTSDGHEHLVSSTEFLEAVLDSVPAFVFWKDLNSVYLGCNQKYAHAVGLDHPSEIVGLTDQDLWPNHTEVDAFRPDDRKVMESGNPRYRYREQLTNKEGHMSWIETTKVPLRDAEGETFGVLGMYIDVTDKVDRCEKNMIDAAILSCELKKKLVNHS